MEYKIVINYSKRKEMDIVDVYDGDNNHIISTEINDPNRIAYYISQEMQSPTKIIIVAKRLHNPDIVEAIKNIFGNIIEAKYE